MKRILNTLMLLAIITRLPATVVLNYTFDSLPDNVTLYNSARLAKMTDGNYVLYTGYSDGYASLGSNFGSSVVSKLSSDFSISIDLLVSSADNSIGQNGNFVWCFASQEPNSNPSNYMMMRVKNGALGYTMRQGSTNNRLETSRNITTGIWQNLTYVREGNTAKLYLNGELIGEKTYADQNAWFGEHYFSPSDLYKQAEDLPYCWLARSAWSGDSYLRGALLDNLRIEDRAFSADEIAQNFSKTSLNATTLAEGYEEEDPTKLLDYSKADNVRTLIENVNDAYQKAHAYNRRSFWDYAVYHTGNMAAWKITGKQQYLDYSIAWGRYNNWQGSTGDDPLMWKYGYGEGSNYALFGDWQCCFQTFIDIYNADNSGLDENERQLSVARARMVMDYMAKSDTTDYWWWADALYMAMPVMTKMWKLTGDNIYLSKLSECFQYSKDLMYSDEQHLFFRDANYIYPQHKTSNDKPDFWSRGNGWVVAGLAKVLADLPEDNDYRPTFKNIYTEMCQAVIPCQHAEGYWTESLQDSLYARCRESSGTCLFTYGLLWGINNGMLSEAEYMPAVQKAWSYLTQIALQRNWTVGYMQPIGAAANENAQLYPTNVTNFGTGAFLLAASEMVRYLENKEKTSIGILETKDPATYKEIYSISGQRLSRMQRGVNIVNGRKIVVK